MAAAAAAVTLLELPVAFLVLAFAPVLQHATATGLLGLQLLRLLFGPASLANIAAAVLCFLLLDDGLWVPALLKAAHALRLLKEAGAEEVQDNGHAGATESLSRQSSITSLAGEYWPAAGQAGLLLMKPHLVSSQLQQGSGVCMTQAPPSADSSQLGAQGQQHASAASQLRHACLC